MALVKIRIDGHILYAEHIVRIDVFCMAEIRGARDGRSNQLRVGSGGTVSCAAALPVLDIIQRDKLMDNAREGGAYLQKGLRTLSAKLPQIREVRGAGLFVGVQLDSRERAARAVNDLRREGVLIGSAGRNADALKIRPPLTILKGEIDLLVATLESVLRSAP